MAATYAKSPKSDGAAGLLGVASASYGSFFESSAPRGLFTFHVEKSGRFTFVDTDRTFAQLVGLGNIDPTGVEPSECLSPALAATLTALGKECVATGAPVRHSQMTCTARGPQWTRAELSPRKHHRNGGISTIAGTFQVETGNSRLPTADGPGQHLLRRIVDTSPDLIYVFDFTAGRNVFLSSRVSRVLGYSAEFLQSLDLDGLMRLIHPDDLSTVRVHMQKLLALSDGAVATTEFRCMTGHAGYRWFRAKDSVLARAPDGTIGQVVGILSDIDRLKKARMEFRQTNARLKSILASISDCYLSLDHDCRVTDANSAAAKWLGTSRGGMVGRLLGDVISGEAQTLVSQAWRKGLAVHAEMQSIIHPGRWVDVRTYPSKDGLGVFFSDITKRKDAERAAARSSALLNASLDSLSIQIAILNKSGTIVACNEAWRRFVASLSARKQSSATSNLFALFEKTDSFGDDAGRITQKLKRLFTGRARTIRHIYRLSPGKEGRWYQVTAARFTHAGESLAVMATEDVTEVRDAKRTVGELSERLLTLQEDERGRIAEELHSSTAQHLAAIGLNAAILRNRGEASAKTDSLWMDVDTSLEHATRELQAFMYILHPVRLGDNGFNTELRRLVEGFAARTGLKCRMKLGSEVEGLPGSLQQCLLRTVQEVLVAAHVHGLATHLSIAQACEDGRLHLTIRDNGGAASVSRCNGGAGRQKPEVDLIAVRETLKQFGGSLAVEVAPGSLRIDASMPYQPTSAGKADLEYKSGTQRPQQGRGGQRRWASLLPSAPLKPSRGSTRASQLPDR